MHQGGGSESAVAAGADGAAPLVPLSYAQNRLWFLDQLQGPSPVYNLAAGLRLAGRLDVDALGAALADVVGRQESLRTLFVAPDGAPQQVVVPVDQTGIGWDVVDATAWSAPQLEEAAVDAARYTFDLSTEIPLRVTLFRLAEDEHLLVAVLHHIVADGGSITPLVTDLGVAYASRCAGRAPDWAPLAVQYADYTLWQRAQLGDLADSESPIAGQLAYWEQALAGLPERLSCPLIGHTLRSLTTAAPASSWTGRRSCSSRSVGGPRAQRNQFHDGAGRPGGAAGQAQRQQRRGPGLRDRRAR